VAGEEDAPATTEGNSTVVPREGPRMEEESTRGPTKTGMDSSLLERVLASNAGETCVLIVHCLIVQEGKAISLRMGLWSRAD